MIVAVCAAGILAMLGLTVGGVSEQTWSGGWHWPALMFAAVEGALAVFGAVWLLGFAQRRLDRPRRWAGPAVSRSAYGAFVLQGVVLIGLALALRPLPAPAEIKAIVVAGAGIVASFGLTWLLITRLPVIRHTL
jgi:hypothetical protein